MTSQNPDKALQWTWARLRFWDKFPGGRVLNRLFFQRRIPELARNVFGIDFPGVVGMGEGIDLNGDFYPMLADHGYAFTEIGPLTLAPEGRYFKGIRHALANLQKTLPSVPLAANLASHSLCTDETKMIGEFSTAFSLLYDFVDFFIINTSIQSISGGISSLEDISFLSEILDELLSLRLLNDKSKPVLVQLSPHMEREHVNRILDYAMLSGIDGVVATGSESVRHIHTYTTGRLPIIARSEAPLTPQAASDLLKAGASLIEMGHEVSTCRRSLMRRINKQLKNSL